ncbi:hypothetical protein, partial [Haemophilus influenzae]|uniref:hypothetical protein n=1 Tax=Haemophilus influenzae TaxID=727 RepID=UPI001C615BD9
NSEVKRCNADGSVGFPHVRVGHRRVIKYKSKSHKKRRTPVERLGFLFFRSLYFNKISLDKVCIC